MQGWPLRGREHGLAVGRQLGRDVAEHGRRAATSRKLGEHAARRVQEGVADEWLQGVADGYQEAVTRG